MRDEQAQRYARHLALPDIGGLGQTALLVASARVPLREREPLAELIAATFLAAGGVGTLVLPDANERQRSDVAAHGADTRVVENGEGSELVLAPRPAWWPAAEGDEVALAFWRGGVAAARWMADTAQR
jgi:hypothetical protein